MNNQVPASAPLVLAGVLSARAPALAQADRAGDAARS